MVTLYITLNHAWSNIFRPNCLSPRRQMGQSTTSLWLGPDQLDLWWPDDLQRRGIRFYWSRLEGHRIFFRWKLQGDNSGLKVAFVVMKFIVARAAVSVICLEEISVQQNLVSYQKCDLEQISDLTPNQGCECDCLMIWYYRRFQC